MSLEYFFERERAEGLAERTAIHEGGKDPPRALTISTLGLGEKKRVG